MSEHARFDLLGSIYDSVGEPGAAQAAMAAISGHLQAAAAYWYVIPKGASAALAGNPFLFHGYLGFTPDGMDEFQNEMWRYDYGLRHASVTDRTTETHELISQAEWERCEFVHWIRAEAGVDRRIARSADLPGGVVAGWAFHLPSGLERSAHERREFDFLAPHVQRLFRLTSQIAETAWLAGSLETLIDDRGQALVLLAADGRILWASRRALELADGLDCRGGRMGFDRMSARNGFEALLARVGAPNSLATGQARGRQSVERPSGARPYGLELSRASSLFRRRLDGRAAFVLTIHDPDQPRDPRPERWRALFGLTAAEAKVAAFTMLGLSDIEIAERLSIGPGTVRSHQRQVLAKTETRSKAEAAHLLTRLS